jgi:hypothetical protein
MKKLALPAIVILAVLMLSVVQPVSAGVEPSPFQPQENELLNMVNNLDTSLILLDQMCTIRSDAARGIIKHRRTVVEDIRTDFNDLYLELEIYIAELPDEEPHGRPAARVLGNGIETVEEIILRVDEYLLNPDISYDKILFTALLGLQGMAAQTLPLMITAWEEVGGVEPSPF